MRFYYQAMVCGRRVKYVEPCGGNQELNARAARSGIFRIMSQRFSLARLRTRDSLSSLLCAALLLAGSPSAFAAEVASGPPAVAAFASLPVVRDVKLSPDGLRYAAIVISGGRTQLVIQPIVSADSPAPLPGVRIDVGERILVDHDWASDERLLFRTRAVEVVLGRKVQQILLSSVDVAGGQRLDFHQNHNELGFARLTSSLVSRLEQDSEHVLAILDNEPQAANWGLPRVHRINVVTGTRKLVQRNRIGVTQWLADAQGEIRLGVQVPTGANSLDTRIYYRAEVDRDWVVLQDVGYFERHRLLPQRFHPHLRNVLLVTSAELMDDAIDGGKPFVFAFDLSENRLLGPYVDEAEARALALLGRAYPGSRIELVSTDDAGRRYVARVSSSTTAPRYVLSDLGAGSVGVLARTYRCLDDWPLAPMRRIDYTARDGLNIPAYLTMPQAPAAVGRAPAAAYEAPAAAYQEPAAAKTQKAATRVQPVPLVVLVHGGPWARDYPGFDTVVQFLASRGYAVLQPQYRGSTGFGSAHLEAGYRQWGLAISDDITDGVLEMIDRGQVDAERICIVGASFGGYAAAMALAKTPDLYRCGISINGVLDLKALINDAWSLEFFGINRAVWNEAKDVRRASPLARASDIRSPLLLLAGTDDTVVPIKHSRRLAKRLQRLKRPVELLELEDGEHWRSNSAIEIAKWSAVEAFLARHLGSATPHQGVRSSR